MKLVYWLTDVAGWCCIEIACRLWDGCLENDETSVTARAANSFYRLGCRLYDVRPE